AGAQQVTGAIDGLDVAVGRDDVDARGGDDTVLDQEVAGLVETGGGIDQMGIDEQGAPGGERAVGLGRGHHIGPGALGRLRDRASSTAMRTATPISTCSRITERLSSATALSISTPRFIGPGCMTM